VSSRTRWWSWMAERRPEMDWPRQRAAATAAAPTTGLLRWFSPQRRCAGRRGGRGGGGGSRGWSRGGSEARERRQRRARPAGHGGRMSCRGAERGERARERAGSGEGDGELGRGSGYPHRAQGHAAWRWERCSRMVATSTNRCRPLRHFTEHVAGSDVGKVEHRFGPLPGRIRHWAINKVCSPRPALRFLFKVPGHLSFVTADN